MLCNDKTLYPDPFKNNRSYYEIDNWIIYGKWDLGRKKIEQLIIDLSELNSIKW